MKVIFIKPKSLVEASYPLGLAYISSCLKSQGHDVMGYDLNIEDSGSLEEYICDFNRKQQHKRWYW